MSPTIMFLSSACERTMISTIIPKRKVHIPTNVVTTNVTTVGNNY